MTSYTDVKDPEREQCFFGHLVIACANDDVDLMIAENITRRMDHEFGKMIYVETRVYSHVNREDYIFEIWLESYDIELLHSKRKARFHNNTWNGPENVDDTQLEYLVDRVNETIMDNLQYNNYYHYLEKKV